MHDRSAMVSYAETPAGFSMHPLAYTDYKYDDFNHGQEWELETQQQNISTHLFPVSSLTDAETGAALTTNGGRVFRICSLISCTLFQCCACFALKSDSFSS